MAIYKLAEALSHDCWNQFELDQVSQPQDPDASDVRAILFELLFGIIPVLFQCGANSLHHSRSDKKSSVMVGFLGAMNEDDDVVEKGSTLWNDCTGVCQYS